MSFRTTGVLLAVLVLLTAAVYFYQTYAPRSPQSAKEKALEIFNYEGQAANIALLEVKQGDKITRVVSKEGVGWTMEAPEQAPVDTGRVSQTVGQLSVLKATSLVSENPDDTAKYGLDTPQLTVSLGVKDRDFQRLLIGMEAPTKTGYYVKVAESKKIFLVSAYIVEDLKKMVAEPPRARPTSIPSPAALATPSAAP